MKPKFTTKADPYTCENLRQWVETYQNQITKLRKIKNKEENIEEENLTEIQRIHLDKLLGYGKTKILTTDDPYYRRLRELVAEQ